MAKPWKLGMRTIALVLAGMLAFGVAQFPTKAAADTRPVNEADPATPVTVSADPLPTVQINGVVWAQVVVGNTVYVGGEFTQARPAGAAAGTNETPRTNLLAYNITTGELISSWAPTPNGAVYSLAASPDGSRIYVGGAFTNVNGQTRNRIAALSPTNGSVIAGFAPNATARVYGISATDTRVYMAGWFTVVNGVTRNKFAAVRPSDGALLSWAPDAQDGQGRAILLSPDGSKVALGGSFTTLNGSSNPGYGLALVDSDTGASLPTPANSVIRNAGPNAAVLSLATDGGNSFWLSGYVFGSGGNLEGVTRISWDTGGIIWIADCHGDTYSVHPMGDVLYAASHSHYCGNLPGGWPQTTPWTMHWGNAFSKSVVSTLTGPDPYGYASYTGQPAPNLLKWEPQFTSGTFTGQNQAAWSVSGNSDYLVYGGEFLRTGPSGTTQQGLVRFARRELAPNKMGPVLSGSYMKPKVTSFATGTVRLAWASNWDRDNEQLTYHIRRNGVEIATVKGLSSEWSRPPMGYLDQGLTPGAEYSYRIFTTDPYGNESRGDSAVVTASSTGQYSAYAQKVLADHPNNYWRLGENRAVTSNTAYDWVGFNDARIDGGVTGNQPGSIIGDDNPASSFSGASDGLVASTTAEAGPSVFSIEAWFKTTTNAGGKIVGFGNANTGNSTSYDRHVYMLTNGQLAFGVYPGTSRTVNSSKAYNDGQWHHAVATLSGAGMVLYVDGRKVASRTDTTTAQAYSGYWRVGGDSPWSGNAYFSGQIDDVAIYPVALGVSDVREHYLASGRTLPGMVAPADPYGNAVWGSLPDLYWRLSETAGTVATDATPNEAVGRYFNGTQQGSASGIGLAGDTSATFDGSNDGVVTEQAFTNPTTFSQELWFKTTTTRGGKLIGFGNSQTGNSTNYDRHVYMLDSGQLRFGVYTGQENLVSSAKSYNDGKWHYLLAQLSSEGMKLYVDSELVGTNPQTGAQDYTGYWRIGGDTSWSGSTSSRFAGSIDEVAIYSKTLTDSERLDHFLKGGGRLPNVAPVADFTFEVDKHVATFTSTATDSDGTIASYLWTFGSGSTSTEANPRHEFAEAGEHAVTLTVTDNEGATHSVTKIVETVDNVLPHADFASEVTKKKVKFIPNATDSDGTVVSYLWDFGDGSPTSTQQSPEHTFADVATYTVTLTVTDNDGGSSTVQRTVTTVANSAPAAGFDFTVAKRAVTFADTSTDSDGSVASYLWDFGDGQTSTLKSPTHTFPAVATYQVTLTVTDNEGAVGTVTQEVETLPTAAPVADFSFQVNNLSVSFTDTSTDSDGSVAGYQWDFGDGATSTLKSPNHTYTTAAEFTVTLTVTDNDGATGSVSKKVTTQDAPAGPLAADAFGRSVSNDWGAADTGGNWTRYGSASLFSVSGGVGRMRLQTAGAGPRAALESFSSTDTEAAVEIVFDKIADGGGVFASLGARAVGTNDYRAKVKVAANGVLTLYLVRVISNAEVTLSSVQLGSAFNYSAGTVLNLKLQAVGTSSTALKAKAWKSTQTEPTWQLQTTDATPDVLQAGGGVALVTYLSGSSTNVPVVVSFDKLLATKH